MLHTVLQAFHCSGYLWHTFSGRLKPRPTIHDQQVLNTQHPAGFLLELFTVRQTENCSWTCQSATLLFQLVAHQAGPASQTQLLQPACVPVSACVCLLTMSQADTIRRWRDYRHGYTWRGWQHLQFPRQRLLTVDVSWRIDACALPTERDIAHSYTCRHAIFLKLPKCCKIKESKRII